MDTRTGCPPRAGGGAAFEHHRIALNGQNTVESHNVLAVNARKPDTEQLGLEVLHGTVHREALAVEAQVHVIAQGFYIQQVGGRRAQQPLPLLHKNVWAAMGRGWPIGTAGQPDNPFQLLALVVEQQAGTAQLQIRHYLAPAGPGPRAGRCLGRGI